MTENTSIVQYTDNAVTGIQQLLSVVRRMRELVFVEGTDFGSIPGTNNKPVLLLPGMEKLLRALHLVPKYVPLTVIEDFDKPLFVYRYECQLVDTETGMIVGAAIGSANSHESKWRWREQKRTCPKCGAEAINRSKYAPKNNPSAEPGWYCYSKQGGCGAEFSANDTTITEQTIGRIENPDVADQMNTIDKIAQKRALSSAIKTAAAVSELFTVDLEDMPGFNVAVNEPEEMVQGTAIKPSNNAPATSKGKTFASTPTTPQNANLSALLKDGGWTMFYPMAYAMYDNPHHAKNSVTKMVKDNVILPTDTIQQALDKVSAHIENSRAAVMENEGRSDMKTDGEKIFDGDF